MHHASGQTVGARVRAARLSKKYTQNRLARPDFSVSYISAIERDQIQPSLRALAILARRLDMSTTDLLPVRMAQLEATTSEICPGLLGDQEQELLLLEAQIAIHQGKAEQAIELLHRLPEQKDEEPAEKTGILATLLGWAYLKQGAWQESEQALAKAAQQVKETTDPLYLRILGLQYTVYTALRNAEQTAQVRQKILHVLADEPKNTAHLAFLARLHLSLAQYSDHLDDSEQAHEHLQHALHLLAYQQLQESRHQLTACYAEKESFTLAGISEQKELLAEIQTHKGEIEYALARAYVKKDVPETYFYLQQMIQAAEARQDHLLLAGARVQFATWAVARGDFAQAEQLVSLAQEQVRPFGETLIGAHAQLLAGELAYRRQDYTTGDRHFTLGLTILEYLGAEEDLIEYLTRYAQILEKNDFAQKSLACWKQAYEKRRQITRFAACVL